MKITYSTEEMRDADAFQHAVLDARAAMEEGSVSVYPNGMHERLMVVETESTAEAMAAMRSVWRYLKKKKEEEIPHITIRNHKHGGLCDIASCQKPFDGGDGFLIEASDESVYSGSICARKH